MNVVTDLKDMLKEYKELIDKRLQEQVYKLGEQSTLRDACEYAILNGGKRYRPAIVLMVNKALKGNIDIVEAALAAEFFHAASLIVDDLPCMDNDDQRRNHPAAHKVFGESVALLASYSLIAGGYQALFRSGRTLAQAGIPDASERVCLVVENISDNLGINGAAGGQYMDLYPPNLKEPTLRQVLHKKTVTLFESAFLIGWLYSGGAPARMDDIKALANHFGVAFQITDDLGDTAQDADNSRDVNYASVLGKAKALKVVKQEVQAYFDTLERLDLTSEELKGLGYALLLRGERRP